jgi:hypothetical protein
MIVERGTSADGQLKAAAASANALHNAKRWIARKTVEGLSIEQGRTHPSTHY